MSRLTKKFNDNSGYEVEEYGAKYNEVKLDAYLDAVNKLGKLEDLEEQLGCPLDVYVKIQLGLVDKVYIKWYKTTDVEWHNGEADIVQEEVTIPFTITRVDKKYFRYQGILWKEDMPFSNYGKEFWLKEDRSE